MSRKYWVISLILTLAIVAPLLGGCSQTKPATSYTAIIPSVMQISSKQPISVSLFAGDAPAVGNVNLTLLKDGKTVSQTQGDIKGVGQLNLSVPDVAEGDYTLQIKGAGFENSTTVKVSNNFLIFLESDKPIYKPGQTIHLRLMTLDSGLKPVSDTATVEIMDAKGIKIYRQDTQTDDFGMATVDMPLSNEPNTGTWKINASTPKTKTELDVMVQEYVLPKYEVSVDLPKDWYLVSDSIRGQVSAEYSFGKPVKGDLTITATKYVGTWVNYATVNLPIDGKADFTIPAAQYVAGVPAAQGNGNVKLNFSVTEMATGYKESTDELLTVSQSSIQLSIIPAGTTFKPGLPYSFMVISETPDNQLVDTSLTANIAYVNKDYAQISKVTLKADTVKGKHVFELTPPQDSVALTIQCSSLNTSVSKTIGAAYSPSGNFIHLEQTSEGTSKVGDNIKFWVYSTQTGGNYYYEVISRGQVLYSNYTSGKEITLTTTPAMAPSSRLLVYQILPNSEVAADYLPFNVTAQYPQNVTLTTSTAQAKPGDNVSITIQAEGASEVGIAAVDKSVYILAENRMNLQQVFDQLEALYMNPQAELHEVSIYSDITTPGAQDVFKNAGVTVLTNAQVPESKKYTSPQMWLGGGIRNGMDLEKGAIPPVPMAAPAVTVASAAPAGSSGGLAEVQRVRQFFPETWIWDTLKTDAKGKATMNVTVPDSITTWMLRAVALSKDKGLGIAEGQLITFQPFFLTVDLPYSAIRGEEFPVSVAVYNYLNQTQDVQVQIEAADWFTLLDQSQKTISIAANEIGSAKFTIRPTKLGQANAIKVTARSTQAADAVIKTLIIDAEGVPQETVSNLVFADGKQVDLSTSIPASAVEGSARTYLAVTSSFLSQTMDGLDALIQMPFGCGEQNMILLAPDIYITQYLKASGQVKPEIMAKAEKLMITGYQRELTYRRSNGSFSAFGESDKTGSLWLTAFVMKSFSDAKELIYIDPEVITKAKNWIVSLQNADGSFDQVGFVHHQDMMGGVQGKTALTAYVALALKQAGDTAALAKAAGYLESQLAATTDPFTLAIMTDALQAAGSAQKNAAYTKLMQSAKEDENGLYWGSDRTPVLDTPVPQAGIRMMPPVQPKGSTSAIEATSYALLALIKQGDNLNASRAAKWLVSKRNSLGGYGSTQDTVMALQALTEYSKGMQADVNMTVNVQSSSGTKQIAVNAKNFDVLQIVELPVNDNVKISVSGQGQAIGQLVTRYNVPAVTQEQNPILKVDVKYDTTEVAVNNLVNVNVSLAFNPPQNQYIEAGMTVVDISVPTGFDPVAESIQAALKANPLIKRYDIAARKVIFYIENLKPGDKINFTFKVKALYPVKAKGVTSQAYSYYTPEISATSLSPDMTVK